jgi:S-adenosylmethionine synthetase
MNIKELADSTSGPVRAALLALEAKVMMLEHDLAESVEQHEEFKQEVSDAVKLLVRGRKDKIDITIVFDILDRFIINHSDPLADAVESVLSGFEGRKHAESYANQIRAALEARGLEIRRKANDD